MRTFANLDFVVTAQLSQPITQLILLCSVLPIRICLSTRRTLSKKEILNRSLQTESTSSLRSKDLLRALRLLDTTIMSSDPLYCLPVVSHCLCFIPDRSVPIVVVPRLYISILIPFPLQILRRSFFRNLGSFDRERRKQVSLRSLSNLIEQYLCNLLELSSSKRSIILVIVRARLDTFSFSFEPTFPRQSAFPSFTSSTRVIRTFPLLHLYFGPYFSRNFFEFA
jgi:hypothetical protein